MAHNGREFVDEYRASMRAEWDRRLPPEGKQELKDRDATIERAKEGSGYESLSDKEKDKFDTDAWRGYEAIAAKYDHKPSKGKHEPTDANDANDNDQSQDRGDHEIGHSKNKKEQGEEYEI